MPLSSVPVDACPADSHIAVPTAPLEQPAPERGGIRWIVDAALRSARGVCARGRSGERQQSRLPAASLLLLLSTERELEGAWGAAPRAGAQMQRMRGRADAPWVWNGGHWELCSDVGGTVLSLRG